MKTAKAQAILAPPSLLGSLRACFDATANHLGLLLIPVALDLFLWLGPHLRLDKLIEGVISGINRQSSIADPETAELLQLSGQYWSLLAERLNLFSAFRSYPVGIPKTVVFFLMILAIDEGLSILWLVPEGHSWLTFISVLRHAFIVTGLIAASFVYYRDANRWLQRLLQQAQLSSIS